MEAFKSIIKNIVKRFVNIYSLPDPINNEEDVEKAEQWKNKVVKLYGIFSILGIATCFLGGLIIYVGILANESMNFGVLLICCVLAIPLTLLTNWGYASMILYFKKMVKSIWEATKIGYQIGEQVKTTEIDIKHEYGNTYKVSKNTYDKGLLFAYITAVAGFVVWAFFCVYVAPFLTYKKYKNTKIALQEYNQAQEVNEA